ncbi:MAG: transketolase [Vicinamibacterales bacterium]
MEAAARRVRESILHASCASGHGHLPTCFSVVEMLLAVYATMRHDPRRPDWAERDVFVLSKGHAALSLYAVLAEHGYLGHEELRSVGHAGSRLGCHADRLKVPGVEVSCGSLGHGIGVAAGMALAWKITRSPRRVFVLVGDGESNEGSVWEAVMVAADRGLDNLTLLYDDNRSQSRCLQIPNPVERFAAFGWNAIDVDGHDIAGIAARLRTPSTRPKALICRTVKGRGCPTFERDVFAWHRRAPTVGERQQLLAELYA